MFIKRNQFTTADRWITKNLIHPQVTLYPVAMPKRYVEYVVAAVFWFPLAGAQEYKMEYEWVLTPSTDVGPGQFDLNRHNLGEKSFTIILSEANKLGSGGCGSVYKGQIHGEWMAIKQGFQGEDKYKFDEVKYILDEFINTRIAKLKNLVKHDVKLYEDKEGEFFLVMPIFHTDLKQMSRGDSWRGINEDERVSRLDSYAGQLLKLVDDMKNSMIEHKDIKPENILIDAEGELVLSDWGLMNSSEDVVTCVQLSRNIGKYTYPRKFNNWTHATRFYSADQKDGKVPGPGDPSSMLYAVGVTLVHLIMQNHDVAGRGSALNTFWDKYMDKEEIKQFDAKGPAKKLAYSDGAVQAWFLKTNCFEKLLPDTIEGRRLLALVSGLLSEDHVIRKDVAKKYSETKDVAKNNSEKPDAIIPLKDTWKQHNNKHMFIQAFEFAAKIQDGWKVDCDEDEKDANLWKNGQYRFCPAGHSGLVEYPNCVSFSVGQLKRILSELGLQDVQYDANEGTVGTFDLHMKVRGRKRNKLTKIISKVIKVDLDRSLPIWQKRCPIIETWVTQWQQKLESLLKNYN